MTICTFLKASIIIFTLSGLGMSLWLFEIVEVKGWYNLNWMYEPLFSPFIGSALVCFAYISPFMFYRGLSGKQVILPFVIIFVINVLCFEVGKQLCYSMYCKFCPGTMTDLLLLLSITVFLFALIALVYWAATDKWIKKNKKTNMILISMLALLAIPLSLITIEINQGFGHQSGWVDAVKMGYPVFWTTIGLGFSGLIIARQKIPIKD